MDVIFRENNIFYNILGFLITENEKLFDRSDAKLYWRTVLHLTVLYIHSYVGLYAAGLEEFLKNSNEDKLSTLHRFRVAYLTGWNFMFQTVFLLLAVAHDLLEWADKQHSTLGSKIRFWRDVIFNGLVVPYTCFVFSMFWSLYAIDRELVFPKVYDSVVPWWFNQCVHTNILVMVGVETVLQARRYPTDKKLELILNATVAILYAIVYYSIYFFANRWLYNVFGIMTWWQVCLFQLGIWASSYIFYIIYFPINRLIHGDEEPEKNKEINSKGDFVRANMEFVTKHEKNGLKNGFTNIVADSVLNEENNIQTVKNDPFKETVKESIYKNGKVDDEQVFAKSDTDLDNSPFSTRSWSLKYRTLRGQVENSSL